MNATPNEGMIEFWNGDAGRKWVNLHEKLDSGLTPLGLTTMAAASIGPGDRVVDVGCGCGATSLELARRVGAEGRVLGVDISEPMLERARQGAAGDENVVFEAGDAQTHGFAEAAFDVVFSRFGVMFFDRPVAAFRNLASALRPGGRVAFICWRAARENPWVALPVSVVAAHVPLPEPPGPDDPGMFAFANGARISTILADAGLVDVAVDPHDPPFLVGGAGGLEQTVAFLMEMGPVSHAIAEADEALSGRIAADLQKALAPHDTGRGVVMQAAAWIVTARAP